MVVSRRALAGLVALGGAGVVLRRDGGGACPRPGRDPGVETRSRNDREDVDGRLWETATVAGWRTDTGLRFTGSLSGDYLDYDGPEGLGSSRQDFAEMPRLVHEDDDCVVVQAGAGVCALERTSGEELWSVPLEARPGAVVAIDSALGEQGSGPPSGSRTWTIPARCTWRTGSPALRERGAPAGDRCG